MARPMPELAPVTSAFWPCSMRCGGHWGMTGRGRWAGCIEISMKAAPVNYRSPSWALARLQQFGDQSGPTGLMRGADAAAGVAVKILVEQHMIAEVLVMLQAWILRVDGALAMRVFEENSGQTRGDL